MSTLLHSLALVILATLTLRAAPPDDRREILVAPDQEDANDACPVTPPVKTYEELDAEISVVAQLRPSNRIAAPEVAMAEPKLLTIGMFPAGDWETTQAEPMAASTSLPAELLGVRSSTAGLLTLASQRGDGLTGRAAGEARRQLLRASGGTPESESAVAAALDWLVAHQSPLDGSWSFDHTAGDCQGRCGDPGTLIEGRNGSTAVALLPLLGSGDTHQSGKHAGAIQRGLHYLLSQIKRTANGGSYHEPSGRMYSHGLATIVLCEAYAMTGDESLREPAQQALDFIAYAQDPAGGGWRYIPKQKGDTSVVGWQVMALKSGRLASLSVDANTLRGANRFLDSVAAGGGSGYGYLAPGDSPATSAVGLLCRMQLGMPHDHPALIRGVAELDRTGPTYDMYYNYYATQVMRHFGGPPWERWNDRLRDWLVTEQVREGHARGSWHFRGGHGVKPGGRLLITAFSTMMLQVYYRHLPLYGPQATAPFEL